MSEWIDCKDQLPEMEYSESMKYWYSDKVDVQNKSGCLWSQCLAGPDANSGGWGSCTGGQPVKWKYKSN